MSSKRTPNPRIAFVFGTTTRRNLPNGTNKATRVTDETRTGMGAGYEAAAGRKQS